MKVLHIVPQPISMTLQPGTFQFTAETALVAGTGAEEVTALAHLQLEQAGLDLPLGEEGAQGKVIFELIPDLNLPGSEGYHLSITPEEIRIRAREAAGLFYGLQSLRQMVLASQEDFRLPCVEIEDYPRFRWRGAMLDVSRHFMPKSFVMKFIDLLALHKLNTFHWHLTDDQGWRIEIKRYPRLTEVGSRRKETIIGRPSWTDPAEDRFDGIPHGGFYTQEEIREVVEYAHQRFVNIVPEIEMPGHSTAAIAAYPELGNTGRPVEVATRWGIFEDIFNVEESTFRFLQNVLDEVMDLFPSPFIHIGGDEVPKQQWRESPRVQQRMRELGISSEEELQSYFVRRMDAFLFARGRHLIGWDEILEGGLAPGAAVMSWRGEAGGIAAAQAGHEVVMAPNTCTYLDYYQGQPEREPLAIGGFIPLEKVYAYEPIPAEIPPDKAHLILGAQAQLWTEYMPTPEHVEYMAFPRLCALSEVVWSRPEQKNFEQFMERLRTHVSRLERLGVNYRKLED